jgi:uncharacterized protein with GYD domain
LLGGAAEDWEDEMPTFVTQARFTKEGFNAMIAAPEDRAEIVGRLIAEVGGKLIAYYLTSGEYDILLIFEGPSYEETVPALIVAAATFRSHVRRSVRLLHGLGAGPRQACSGHGGGEPYSGPKQSCVCTEAHRKPKGLSGTNNRNGPDLFRT